MATINDRQPEIFLEILKEYTSKLRQRCREWTTDYESARTASSLMQTTYFAIIISIGANFVVRRMLFSSTNIDEIVSPTALVVFTIFMVHQFLRRRAFRKGLQILEEEVRMLANPVARLIRLSSQRDEHTELGFEQRLLLDLRLAEAEESLRYFNKIVRPQMQFRDIIPPIDRVSQLESPSESVPSPVTQQEKAGTHP